MAALNTGMKFRRILPLFQQARRRISALYVTGDKASENYAVLTPYMEFRKTLIEGKENLYDNVTRRRMNLDLSAVMKKYELYRSKELLKDELERRREEVANDLKQLQKSNDKSSVEAKRREGIELRNALKTLKEELYPIEDDFIHDFLKLPNTLSRSTPTDEEKLLYRHGLPKSNSPTSECHHLNYKDLIDYRDPTCYYLMKDAAHFDFYTLVNCVRRFLDHSYTQFVNPDFVRTLLLEAATIDPDQVDTIEEVDAKESKVNLLHLTGGGSSSSFLGFITKLSIFPTLLPLRFVASGREYVMADDVNPRGLYTAAQSNSVQTFIAAKDESQLEDEIETTLGIAIDIFRQFDVHYRIVYLPAHQLSAGESLRASIQMFSPFYDQYIEVGHLSNYSDYLSKRLLFNFKEGKSYKFPHIAVGSVLNITKLLACLLENGVHLTVPTASNQTDEDAIKNFKNLFS